MRTRGLLALAAVTLSLTACGSSDDGDQLPPAQPLKSEKATGAGTVTPAAAEQLCVALRTQNALWRKEGAVAPKPDLNVLVSEWAVASGLNAIDLMRNRGIVDELASKQCPQDHATSVAILDTDDLASALAGF